MPRGLSQNYPHSCIPRKRSGSSKEEENFYIYLSYVKNFDCPLLLENLGFSATGFNSLDDAFTYLGTVLLEIITVWGQGKFGSVSLKNYNENIDRKTEAG